MNTAIYTDARRAANIGIGFATPINLIRDLLPQLERGKVTRGRIGVSIHHMPMSREDIEDMGLPSHGGALVADVPDGPAKAAGKCHIAGYHRLASTMQLID